MSLGKLVFSVIVLYVTVLSGITRLCAQTTIFAAPETSSVSAGGTVTLVISISDVANLHGAHVVISFDNSIISAETITEGSFLASNGGQVFFSYVPNPAPSVNSISVDQAILGSGSVSGSGALFGVTFRGVGGGTSSVTLSSVSLRDSLNHIIQDTVLSGSVTVVVNSVTVNTLQGWDMISNPMTTANDSVRQLYPASMFEYAYAYSPGSGYVQSYTMTNGSGYWERFPAAEVQTVFGLQRSRDSIAVVAGWNMIGTISNTVDTSTIVSIPPGLRVSSWYGFGSSGYNAVTQLIPGKAYWVFTSGPGKFILASPSAGPPLKAGR